MNNDKNNISFNQIYNNENFRDIFTDMAGDVFLSTSNNNQDSSSSNMINNDNIVENSNPQPVNISTIPSPQITSEDTNLNSQLVSNEFNPNFQPVNISTNSNQQITSEETNFNSQSFSNGFNPNFQPVNISTIPNQQISREDTNLNSQLVSNEFNPNFQPESKIEKHDQVFLNQVSVPMSKVGEEYVFDDGIDSDDTTKNKFGSFFTNKKFLLIVAILTFIFTSITVAKTFYLRDKVDEYEEFSMIVDSKDSTEIIIDNGVGIDTELIKNSAASSLISCINETVSTEELSDDVKNIIKEINDYYNESNNYFAFVYQDIYTGFTVSYNDNQDIFTASTIKAPVDIYIYEMASLGKINLDDRLTYTSGYYNTGSGTLKNNKFGTTYDIKTLVNYSIIYSDNAAHNMLMDKYGRDNLYNFWSSKGTRSIFTANNNWGVLNAHDALIYMNELYRFYLEDNKYGEELMSRFLLANPKFIKGKNGYQVANKSGWSGSVIHDVSIVFANNPYIIVALSNLGMNNNYQEYFDKVNDLAYRLHTEYWKYKMDKCSLISQY